MFLTGLSFTLPPNSPYRDRLEHLTWSVSVLGNTDLILNFLPVGLVTFFVKWIAPLCLGFSTCPQNTTKLRLLQLSLSTALTHFTVAPSETHFTLGFQDTTFSLIFSFPEAHLSFYHPFWLRVLFNLGSSWPTWASRGDVEPSLSQLSLVITFSLTVLRTIYFLT